MTEVLVAPLGDHPAIISAAVQKLRHDGVAIERVYILCPNEPMIQLGAEWLQLELEDTLKLQTEKCDLLFADANSEQAAMEYLQALAATLQTCEAMNDNVHLLLAGGRKNLSALTGVIAQFFPCVQKLYHLLDVYEDDPRRRNLFSVTELIEDDKERKRRMFPPAESLILFEVPLMPPLEDATDRRKAFADMATGKIPSVTTDAATDAFWSDIFGAKTPKERLDLWVSEAAWQDYEELSPEMRQMFKNCFKKMTTRQSLDAHAHGAFQGQFDTDCHCFDADSNPARPFSYLDGKRLVLCRLVYHPDTYERLISGHNKVLKKDHVAFKPLANLLDSQSILVTSLGDSPMVVSQAYTLLQQRYKVLRTVVLYPDANRSISNTAQALKAAFEREGAVCELKPIQGLSDVKATADCEIYLRFVAQIVTELQQQNQEAEINLLLSGGRKSMAVLNLFAAQRAGLAKVLHTLVNDSKLERQIEDDLRNAVSSHTARRNILFLRNYSLDQFTLFPVPVFSLRERPITTVE